MTSSRLAPSWWVNFLGGSLIALAPAGSGPALACDPGLQPPPSLSTVDRLDPASETQTRCPATANDLDPGPCWHDEEAADMGCPWTDYCDTELDDYEAYEWEDNSYDDSDYSYDEEATRADEYEPSYFGEGDSPQDTADLEEEGWSYHDDGYGYEDTDETANQQREWYTCDEYESYDDDEGECSYDEDWACECEVECYEQEDDENQETGPTFASDKVDRYDECDYDTYEYVYDDAESWAEEDGYDYEDRSVEKDTVSDCDEYDYDDYEYDTYEYEYVYDEEESRDEEDGYGYEDPCENGPEFDQNYGYDKDWDGYEDEYGCESWEYEHAEYEHASPHQRYGSAGTTDHSPEQQTTGTHEEATCEGYSDAYPDEEFAYPEDAQVSDEYSDEYECECDYDEAYWDEYEYMDEDAYRHEVLYKGGVDDGPEASPQQEDLVAGLELFAWHPAELLIFADQELLRSLDRLSGEPSGARRAMLNDYLESLGWEAIDFAFRFEDVTGTESLGLVDDMPGLAALLASFRLVEQGELGMDEGVEVLRRTLEDVTLDWIEGIDEITADACEDSDSPLAGPAARGARPFDPTWLKNPVVELIVSLAAETLGELGDTILGISERLSELGREPAPLGPLRNQAASRAAAPEAPRTR